MKQHMSEPPLEPVNDMDILQGQVVQWAEDTFTTSTTLTVASHLLSEAAELFFAAGGDYAVASGVVHDAYVKDKRNPHTIREEAGGVGMLLLHLAGKENFSLREVVLAVFQRDKARKWLDPNRHGFREHDPRGDAP
jgi:hypothetical protein